MSRNVNIYFSLDLEKIIGNQEFNSNVDNPTLIKPEHAHIIVLDTKSNLLVDHGGEELSLSGMSVGSRIYWKVSSLSRYDSAYSVLLTKYIRKNSSPYIQKPSLVVRENMVRPILTSESTSDSLVIKPQKIPMHYWETSIDNVGNSVTENYIGYFTVYDNKAQVKGYCKWEHKLTLSDIE
ncbi:hypothetical protein HZS38_06865 [Xenorhabdus nematophila]|uniref:AidA/PixA family protein n=1 Tax=Xenorhabdus nematophila TaxID=628 RepID=UPI00032755BC|nr:AidA/PixA family protein [Xenorhabdus nematophila]CEE93172.1 hypothetical protein XNA1_3470002 [Xenorhabdus nematophila str. Anatoliense]CEF30623.1 hypothetical protein XNW1_2720001 [Xenorhabdus nematophila str. Websteri]AYA40214.1 hypothetical protein D3790_06905 [Xenorhabdus nematophila]KHD27822.1 hypothetical protein LH67_15130 [Xenorhabdus nematophila]MBA0018885.1 hypothetical protein [Xenorhabdus nematophila]